MTFQEALHRVITEDIIVMRRMHQFKHDYDNPNSGPQSEWVRIRLEDDTIDFDALVFFECCSRDDNTNTWLTTWHEDQLSREDIQAIDWETSRQLPSPKGEGL